jgi:ATP-dependent Clp protease, protease subunit
MKFLVTLLLVFSLFSLQSKADQPAVLTLHKRNTLVLRNVIDEESVAQLQAKAVKMSNSLLPNETINLVLDTPGGSIGAGDKLITTLKALPQKVNTVTTFSASMGFITVQSLGTRYITPGGILMSHRASGGAQGQIPGELNTRVKFFTEMLDRQDAVISKRVGMSKGAYQKLIDHEYWVSGDQAVSSKMADRVVLVRCDSDLASGTSKETIQTFFGPVELTYSDCPVISAPLEINFSGLSLRDWEESDKTKLVEIRKLVLSLVYNKQEFYHEYFINNKYRTIFL